MLPRQATSTDRSRGDRRKVAALVTVCLGYFMVILDTTVVTVALPDLRRELGTEVAGLAWVVDGYVLALAAFLLPAGGLGDRVGARRTFLAGLATFAAASAGCAAAATLPVLVAARVAQGLGAALLIPSSLALVHAVFPDPAGRARAIGVWGGRSAGWRPRPARSPAACWRAGPGGAACSWSTCPSPRPPPR